MKHALAMALAAALVGFGASRVGAEEPNVDAYYSKTFNDCMAAAGGSTLPMRDCQDAEYQDWDKALNQVYQVLMASRSPAEKIELRDDERAWLKRTKHKCDHAGDDEAGGTLQPIEIQACYLDETIRRTVYLRGLH
jgi:uncharacterized protein YecT (DUF1311 family)